MRDLLDRSLKWTLAAMVYAFVAISPAAAQEIPLGTSMPMAGEALPDAAGGQATLASLQGAKGTAVVFWSNQCPWIDKYQERLLELVSTFRAQGMGFVLVNSNDAEAYPQEALAESAARGYNVPYLMDADSKLARAFGAERTPHVFVFDPNDALVYVGAIDDSPGDPANVQKQYLRDALTALSGGGDIAVPQTKAFGCQVKFKN